jgi:hypothetical protein
MLYCAFIDLHFRLPKTKKATYLVALETGLKYQLHRQGSSSLHILIVTTTYRYDSDLIYELTNGD